MLMIFNRRSSEKLYGTNYSIKDRASEWESEKYSFKILLRYRAYMCTYITRQLSFPFIFSPIDAFMLFMQNL